jgi:hypothetical protein
MTLRLRDLPGVPAAVRAQAARELGAAICGPKQPRATRSLPGGIRGLSHGPAAQAPLSAAGSLIVVVPMPPHVGNTGGRGKSRHWSVGNREKRAYHATLDAIAAFCAKVTGAGWCGFVIPPAPAAPLERATVTSHMVLGGAMDDDNAVVRHKALADWLVRRRYLASDRRTCLRWGALPAQTVTRKEPPRITLTLTED